MSLSPEEVELRRRGLGASEIAAILGVNPWRSALDVYLSKTGRKTERSSARTDLGHRIEPVIRDWYIDRQGECSWEVPTTLVHPELPWAMATPDCLLHLGERQKLAEFKMVGHRIRPHWTSGVPGYVVTQVLWQMFVTGIHDADVAVWFGLEEDDQDVIPVRYDAALVEEIRIVAEHFWHYHVEKDLPPDPEPTEDWMEYLISRFPVSSAPVMPMPNGAEEWALRYLAANAAITAAEQEKQLARTELQWILGFSEGMENPKYRVSWKSDAEGQIAWKALAMDLHPSPELIAKYTGKPPRRFTVRELREKRRKTAHE